MRNCDEFRPLLCELALGDLDAEPARELREHLAGCAGCRVEASAVERTLGRLKTALPPSTERRLVAVQAMTEAREAAPARRRWLAVAAAALAAAGVSLVWLASRPEAGLTASEVTGQARRLGMSESRWTPLAAGDRIAPGDRVVVDGGGSLRLEGRGSAVVLEAGTALGLTSDGRLTLERGLLRIEAAGARGVAVLDTANNAVTVRRGRAAIGLRQVRGMVAGSFETRGAGTSAPEPREVVADRLTIRMADGEADLDGSFRQRLRVTAGQEGGFEFDGRPFTRGEGR